jgi:hypothetical protein
MPMALESWLSKVRSAMSSANHKGKGPKRRSSVGILAFEVGSLMSKLLQMWRAVSDAGIARLHHDTINLDGVRKVVCDDDDFLLGLTCAELLDALRAASDSVAALAARCADPTLREFRDAFLEFADTGRDRHRWATSSCWKEMDRMEKQVASTTALRRAMEELAEAEHGLRKLLIVPISSGGGGGRGHHRRASSLSVAAEQQQVIFSKKQEVKHLKQTSIWGCTFDAVVASLARVAFTTLARIKLVFFGLPLRQHPSPPAALRTLSSAVHPDELARRMDDMEGQRPKRRSGGSFFESKACMTTPPPGTLGADALAPRYAGLVISIERMAKSPRPEERDELYSMLTASVRAQLRARLRGAVPAADPELAGQWRAALAGILEWLAPMAHATMRWQAERSFERRATNTDATAGGNVLLLQTLHFADRHRVEAALSELLVGLNYVCRFHMEMTTSLRRPPAMPMEQ